MKCLEIYSISHEPSRIQYGINCANGYLTVILKVLSRDSSLSLRTTKDLSV